ncbi:M14 metallopeptidase family protein [Bacteroidota bacterium]
MKKNLIIKKIGVDLFFSSYRGRRNEKCIFLYLALLIFFISGSISTVNAQEKITSPQEQFGFDIGDDYRLINYTRIMDYWTVLESESDRIKLINIGNTAEGREQYMAIISSPENINKLDYYREISSKLALAKGLNENEAKRLSKDGKAVVWIDGGLHATEVVGSHQLMKLVYNMVSNNDEETLRILNDVILLAVFANPDGLELIADWYMRKEDEKERSTRSLPRLYQKYVGHDNNRDSYMVTQPETENMAKVMYKEWYPQIMYNTHQSAPADMIVYMPPFRDPPNYNYDPLIIMGIQALGTAMNTRLIAEGLPGGGMRSKGSFSTWFNGNLRTTGYFHNQIGLLTETKGNPTPMQLSFYPDGQLMQMDLPYPVQPKTLYFREAIKYSVAMDMAILDYASRYKETVLFNRYLMGNNHIEKGSQDNWTIHPKIVTEVKQAISDDRQSNQTSTVNSQRRGGSSAPAKYFELFRKPENRDARAYILPSDQDDFPTATKFVNTFIKNGIEVLSATKDFKVDGKSYPAGSYIFKTDQAFRPHILDLFEPQDYPNDFAYEGGPPIAPYDNAGYTLAFQMGIEFDRILEAVEGPFEKIDGKAKPLAGKVINPKNSAGFILSHKINDASIVMNRLLAEKHQVYWLTSPLQIKDKNYPAGTIYIPSKKSSLQVLENMAAELGVSFEGISKEPELSALQIYAPRIGLWDRFGGSMQSGWTRWILEQYEFPFELVYPKRLDEGNLNKDFDVLVFVSGAIPSGQSRAFSSGRERQSGNSSVDEEYQHMLGQISGENTIPQLVKFLENGGTILTIGSSTNLAQHLELPMGNHIVGADGNPLGSDDYFVPSSILQVRVDNTLPIAYGMNERVDIFFSRSPVFRFKPDADKKGLFPVAWFDSDQPLRSGWAWGQDRLYGGVSIAKAEVGKGNLYLFGPEILFRAQSHGTFKLFFNGLFLSAAKKRE